MELLRVIYGRVDKNICAAGLDIHLGASEICIWLDLEAVINFIQ